MVSGAGPTPGLKLHGLDIWESSALPGIFASIYAQEYLFFRSYALTILSDAGYLDHLIDNLPNNMSLRIIDSIGAATGIVCAVKLLATPATPAASSTSTTATTSPPTTSDSSMSIKDVKVHSISIIKRMLRRGMTTTLMDSIVGQSDNVLKLFITLDNRYFPIDEATTSAAENNYHSWSWDASLDFWTNIGNFENLLLQLRDTDSSFKPSMRDQWTKIKLSLLRIIPAMLPHTDFMERTGGPCGGTAITSQQWIKMGNLLSQRYLMVVGTPSTSVH